MKKQRVALFCSENLLGEGIELLLGKLSDVEILGPWIIDNAAERHLEAYLPDIVLIAGENVKDQNPITLHATLLTTKILDMYTGLPVVQVMMERNQVRIYNSHTIPARSADLIEAIRRPWAEDKGS